VVVVTGPLPATSLTNLNQRAAGQRNQHVCPGALCNQIVFQAPQPEQKHTVMLCGRNCKSISLQLNTTYLQEEQDL